MILMTTFPSSQEYKGNVTFRLYLDSKPVLCAGFFVNELQNLREISR